jgi:histone H3/H4
MKPLQAAAELVGSAVDEALTKLQQRNIQRNIKAAIDEIRTAADCIQDAVDEALEPLFHLECLLEDEDDNAEEEPEALVVEG